MARNLCADLKSGYLTFDCRVNVTSLLDQYELTFAEANKILQEYLQTQEKNGIKYEKQYLVKGLDAEHQTAVFTIAQDEQKLKHWLQQLQNAESLLYAVEVAGGTKSPAYIFQPIEHCAVVDKNVAVVATKDAKQTNGSSAAHKTEIKSPQKKMQMPSAKASEAAKPSKSAANGTAKEKKESSVNVKTEPKQTPVKSTPKKTTPKKISPEERKNTKPAAAQKGIGNYFAASTSTAAKKEEKTNKTNAKSPKQINDFFKKQAEKPKSAEAATKAAPKVKDEKKSEATTATVAKIKQEKSDKPDANMSVQLFEAEDSADSVSSDEEEKLAALRREIITSDKEDEASDEEPINKSSKRRRVLDSDDEDDAQEEPQQKQEKIEAASEEVQIKEEEEEPAQAASETFLDEEGFVVTVKPKKAQAAAKKSPKKKPKMSPQKPAKQSAPAAAAKTKQGSIMNFFSKK